MSQELILKLHHLLMTLIHKIMVITKKKNVKKLDKLRKSGINDIRIVEIILSEKMVKSLQNISVTDKKQIYNYESL